MEILYVSNYIDDDYFKQIFETSRVKPDQNMQKFSKLLVSGLSQDKRVDNITVVSAATVNRSMNNRLLWKGKNSAYDKVKFWYLPFLNLKFVKQFCMLFFSIFFVLFWILKNLFKRKNIVVDGFYPVVSTVSIVICRLLGIYVSSFYTDVVQYDVNDVIKKKNFIRRLIKKIINFGDVINRRLSNSFIFLTEQMNDLLNKKGKPYIVIDCLVDSAYVQTSKKSRKNKAFLYAGGLNEKYGVKLMIDSFIAWNKGNYELWLCGDGDLVPYIMSLKKDSIKYFGSLLNSEVLELEKEAMLLINPRFSNEEYTKYSFPSKNMEYMLSGTPVLTTRLPGIGEEYSPYLFYFDEENESGFIKKYEEISKLSFDKLNKKGLAAKNFVLKNKNNKLQGKKIVGFIKDEADEIVNKNRMVTIFAIYNFALLLISIFNPFGLFKVNFSTYLLYTVSIMLIIFGINVVDTVKVKKKKAIKCDLFNSKLFEMFLYATIISVGSYLIRYLLLIPKISPSRIRLAAFSDIFLNGYDEFIYLYIVCVLVLICQLLLPLFIFDKSLVIKNKKRKILLLLLIVVSKNLIGFSRSGFLEFILESLFVIVFFTNVKQLLTRKNVLRFIMIILIIFGLSTCMLYFRTSSSNNLIESLSLQFKQIFDYFLGSFRMLNDYLQNGMTCFKRTYGRATFAGFDEIVLYPIRYFFRGIKTFNQQVSICTQTGYSVGTNTPYYNAFYTSIMNFYMDFKEYGIIAFSLIYGVFIGKIFKLYNSNKHNVFFKMLFVYIAYNLIVGQLKWPYQTGNVVFTVILLLLLGCYYNRGVRYENNVDS